MLIYKFVGGRDDGVIAIADREPVGDVSVQGRQLADGRGHIVGRVVQDWETPPPAIAALVRRAAHAPSPVSAASPTNGAAPVFDDEQTWRRHVKAWGIEQGMVSKSARGRCTSKVLDAWRAEHGDPVYR